jgi:hypothetical protein
MPGGSAPPPGACLIGARAIALAALGRRRAGLVQQRFRDFLREIAEVERPVVALSASLVGNADVGGIDRKPSNQPPVSSVCASKSPPTRYVFFLSNFRYRIVEI